MTSQARLSPVDYCNGNIPLMTSQEVKKMAECAVARCVQERRSLRRELQKWGKDILLLVGFESMAEGLLGHDEWNNFSHYTIEGLSSYASDWVPEEICCFCNLRKCPPPDPARGICSIDGFMKNGLGDGEANYDSEGHFYSGSCASLYVDQPLDLSVGSGCKAHTYWALMAERDVANAVGSSQSVLKVPQLPTHPGKLKRRLETLACKRSYTEDELQAAIDEISSGRLGTRKAAVVYGIPRSTLRNKVYKLTLEGVIPILPKCGEKVLDAVKVEVEGEEMPSASPMCPSDPLEEPVVPKKQETRSVSETLRNLIRSRMMERAAAAATVPYYQTVPNGKGWLRGLQPLLSQVLTNGNHEAVPNQVLLPNLIRRLTEQRFLEERRRVESLTPKVMPNNVILKIPSYKPTKSCAGLVVKPPARSSSQKEPCEGTKGVIRRVAAKKEEEDVEEDEDEEDDEEYEDAEEDEDTDECPLTKRCRKVARDRDKRIRPKRGRYRNYRKADLADAVRAVQRGQMSVHRAGSYYGVPHSTLEYKVKERHLLRSGKCKRSSQGSAKEPGLLDATVSSCCSSNSNSLSAGEKCNPDDSGGTAEGPLWPVGHTVGVDLNSDHFFASQMMKKLQEDARLSREQSQPQSYGAHETLLLSVLLRSGLAVQPKGSLLSSATATSSTAPPQSTAHRTENCSAQV